MIRPELSTLQVEIFPGIKEEIRHLLNNSNFVWAMKQAHLFKKHPIELKTEPPKKTYLPWVRKKYSKTGLSIKALGIKEYRRQWAKLNHDRFLECRRNWRRKQKLQKES